MANLTNKNMELDSIFAVPVGIMNDVKLTEDEMSFILSQKMEGNIGNLISSDQYVLDHPQMASLRNVLLDCMQQYFEFIYKPNDYVRLKLTQSWTNISQNGEYHHLHFHQNSLVSGCLYIEANEEEHKIMFHRMSTSAIYIHYSESNIFNAETWAYPVKPGKLILFPSSLHHSVPRNESKNKRISLAFNAFPIGILGKANGANELKLS